MHPEGRRLADLMLDRMLSHVLGKIEDAIPRTVRAPLVLDLLVVLRLRDDSH